MAEALVTAETELEVQFQDCDPVEIVWHGNYFRYFEAARAALLRKIDYDYPVMRASQVVWPVVEAHVRFARPLRYGQRIRVRAGLVEWENRMKIQYRVAEAESGTRVTTGYTVQCAVDVRTWEIQWVSPPDLLERLKAWL
ncbi:MAG TPA: thioesterase family protein [Gammaproteobacteria bacterium]|nr:thioesterase family protein [Gammaproteobacteria bacterium]